MFLENVVIGSSYESHLYSLLNNYYHISNLSADSLFYDILEIGFFGVKNRNAALSHVKLALSFRGMRIPSTDVEKITIVEDIIKVSSRAGTKKYGFEKCFVFNGSNVSLENKIISPDHEMYKVIDYFKIKNTPRIMNEIPDFCRTKNSFVSRTHFYKSGRVLGAAYITDCISESYLSPTQLSDWQYSDTAAKFIIQNLLLEGGYPGRKIGEYKNGKTKYLKMELTHKERKLYPQFTIDYQDSEKVKLLKLTEREVLVWN